VIGLLLHKALFVQREV